jgi:uncharacterized protein YbaR (Trm112 family)
MQEGMKQKSKVRAFFGSPWTIAIVGGTTAYLLPTWIVSLATNVKWSDVLLAVLRWIGAVFTFRIPVWIFLTVLVVCVLIARLVSAVRSGEKKPPFLGYTQDTIREWHWSWQWQEGADDRYEVKNLCPICPTCRTSLFIDKDDDLRNLNYPDPFFYCPRCKAKYPMLTPQEVREIEETIMSKVRLKQFPQASSGKP